MIIQIIEYIQALIVTNDDPRSESYCMTYSVSLIMTDLLLHHIVWFILYNSCSVYIIYQLSKRSLAWYKLCSNSVPVLMLVSSVDLQHYFGLIMGKRMIVYNLQPIKNIAESHTCTKHCDINLKSLQRFAYF